MFTATRLQAATYLLGVCLFSIAFLVFLNSSVSFVITSLIKQRTHVGDAVGTLGFVDELVIIVACPAWGAISDRVGVRTVGDPFPLNPPNRVFRVRAYDNLHRLLDRMLDLKLSD